MRSQRVDEVSTKLDDETLRQREEYRGEKGLSREIETVYRMTSDNGVSTARNEVYLNGDKNFGLKGFEKR